MSNLSKVYAKAGELLDFLRNSELTEMEKAAALRSAADTINNTESSVALAAMHGQMKAKK